MTNKKFLVIAGCARSGTKYSYKYFREFGYNISHEVPDHSNDGISSCYALYGLRIPEDRELVIFHQVRDPIKAISSAAAGMGCQKDFMVEAIPELRPEDPVILRAMRYWYHWNLMITDLNPVIRYQVEHITNKDIIVKFCDLLGVRYSEDLRKRLNGIDRTTNTYHNIEFKHEKYSWQDLEDEDITLTNNIKKLAGLYGYTGG